MTNSNPFSSTNYVDNFYNEAEALLIEKKPEPELKKKRIIKKIVTTFEVDEDEK